VNKSELIDALADRLGTGKREAQAAVDGVIETITRAVVAGEKVAITGFGIFEKVERGARTARNPRTGATVRVKKTQVPKFRPGAELKAFVAGTKKLAKAAAAPVKAAPAAAKKATTTRTTATKKAAPAAKKATTTRTAAKKAAPAAKKTTTTRTTAAKRTTTATKAPARKAPARKAPAKKTTTRTAKKA
jgi:DNA-binding protein HU-beta